MSISTYINSLVSKVHNWVLPAQKRTTMQWIYFLGSILLVLGLLFVIFKFGIMKVLGGKKPPPMTEEEEMEMRGGGGGDLEAAIVAASGNAENYVGDDEEDEDDEDDEEGGSIIAVVVGNDCGKMELSGVDKFGKVLVQDRPFGK